MPKVQVTGVAELRKEFAQWANVDVEPTTLKAARIIERDAKARAPVLTGRLRRSIRARLRRNRLRAVVVADVGPGPEVPYAGIVEARQPYMAPAADSKQLDVERTFLAAVDAALEKGRRV